MDDYRNPFSDVGKFFKSRAVLPRLILINAAVWMAISLVRVLTFLINIPDATFTNYIVNYFALPADTTMLMHRPWTLVTYMFLHIEIWHILFNMLWLYWFGKIFLEYLNSRQLLVTYLLGGFAGGALYVLAYNLFPVFKPGLAQSSALGASAAVMAIVTAISFYVPNYSIYMLFLGRIKIFYIAIILFILDFFMIRSNNAGGHIAHIGGALYGFAFVLFLKHGMDFSKLFKGGNTIKSMFRKKRSHVRPTGNSGGRPLSDEEYNIQKKFDQKRMDDILDKISKSGYESLSKEEKEFLFHSGNKNN